MARIRISKNIKTDILNNFEQKHEYDIFISYRRNPDEDKVRALYLDLKHRGYSVFFDHDSIRDGHFDENIKQAIQSAPIFILFMSDDSLRRCSESNDIMRKEIEYAIKLKKKIIPIIKSPSKQEFPSDMPDIFTSLRTLEISKLHNDSSYNSDIERLINDRICNVVKCKNKSQESTLTLDTPLSNFTSTVPFSGCVIIFLIIFLAILGISLLIINL